MSIKEKIKNDMVSAMKARDKDRTSALRMILSTLQLAHKEADGELDEAGELKILTTEKKRRYQAAEAFRSGGREDRARKEEEEVAIIDTYLPQALSEEELAGLVDEAVATTSATSVKDMGKVMAEVMKKVAGRADGQTVSAMVKSRLAD